VSTTRTTDNSPSSAPDGVELIPSRRGGLTCRIRGRFYHSSFNPEEEAARIISHYSDKKAALIIGPGLGYLSRAWSSASHGSPALAVILSQPTAAAAKEAFPDTSVPAGVIRISADDTNGLRDFLVSLDRNLLSNLAVIENPAAAALFPELVQTVHRNATRITREVLSDLLTGLEFECIWARNILRNIPSLLKSFRFLDHVGTASGAAVIAGAGPTLPDCFPFLRANRGRAPLFATDTTLPALTEAGIQPDWVVSLDGQLHNLRDFNGIDTSSLRLLTEPTVYHAVPGLPFKEVVFFEAAEIIQTAKGAAVCSHPLILWIKQCLGEPGPTASGGNVTTTALALASAMGYNSLYLVGVDNAFPGWSYHCRGSYTHRIDSNRCNRLNTVEKLGQERIRRRMLLLKKDYNGDRVLSDPVLEKFALWSGEAARDQTEKQHWRNLSPRAMRVHGIPCITPEKALEEISGIATHKKTVRPKGFTDREQEMRKRLEKLDASISGLLNSEIEPDEVSRLFGAFPFLNRTFGKQLLYIERKGGEENADFLLRELCYQLSRTRKHCRSALRDLCDKRFASPPEPDVKNGTPL